MRQILNDGRAVVVVLFGASVALGGCGSSPSTGDGGAPPDAASSDGGPGSSVCARTSTETLETGETIQVCEEAHAEPPRVNLPADAEPTGGVAHVHGGLVRSPDDGSLGFRTRSAEYPVPPETSWLDRERTRYGYLIYRATVRDGVVEDVVPVVRIDDAVLQRLLQGLTLEGAISEREVVDGEVRFTSPDSGSPVRVQLDAAIDTTPVDGTGQPRYRLYGTIENADAAVRASDGSCMPALSSLGDANPLLDAADDRVFVLRHPNMHGAFDDVFTLDWPAGVTAANNMGGGLFIPTADLLLGHEPTLVNASSSPHGVPWGGPRAELTAVEDGGGGC